MFHILSTSKHYAGFVGSGSPAREGARDMPLRVRSKIWIENDKGQLVIGTGRLRILQTILETGSINKAAQKLKQPFRAVWGKIRATEERCGFKIVERTSEGSKLTREGLELLWTYTRLRNRCEKFTDTQFSDLFDTQAPAQTTTDTTEY
jgi:molybdate transport system regulatory protein